jgi:DNA anti-recombination protein RmuC
MVKNMEEHCKKLEERIQSIQQEFQEQLGEQSRKTDQISVQIETLSTHSKHSLLTTGKEMESTSKVIL